MPGFVHGLVAVYHGKEREIQKELVEIGVPKEAGLGVDKRRQLKVGGLFDSSRLVYYYYE